jgi:hypothetical protein
MHGYKSVKKRKLYTWLKEDKHYTIKYVVLATSKREACLKINKQDNLKGKNKASILDIDLIREGIVKTTTRK